MTGIAAKDVFLSCTSEGTVDFVATSGSTKPCRDTPTPGVNLDRPDRHERLGSLASYWRPATDEDEHRRMPSPVQISILDADALAAWPTRSAFRCILTHQNRICSGDPPRGHVTCVVDQDVVAPWSGSDPVIRALASTWTGRQRDRVVGGLAPWRERRAKALLANDLLRRLTLPQVAAECRLSVAHFTRAFKISVGITPHAWLQHRRIDHAKSLLSKTPLSLSQIAASCGFSDQSHFTKVFSRLVGQTPGCWKRVLDQ